MIVIVLIVTVVANARNDAVRSEVQSSMALTRSLNASVEVGVLLLKLNESRSILDARLAAIDQQNRMFPLQELSEKLANVTALANSLLTSFVPSNTTCVSNLWLSTPIKGSPELLLPVCNISHTLITNLWSKTGFNATLSAEVVNADGNQAGGMYLVVDNAVYPTKALISWGFIPARTLFSLNVTLQHVEQLSVLVCSSVPGVATYTSLRLCPL